MPFNKNALSRREFLLSSTQTAASILAISTLASCDTLQAVPKEKRGSKMRFGMVTYQWGEDWDLPTLIKNCEAAKVLGVELRSGNAHGVENTLNEQQRKDVKKRFADSGVTLVGLGAKIGFDSPDPAELKKNIDFMKEFIKLSRDVGSSGVRAMPNKKHKEVPIEKTIEQIGKSINELGQFGADYGQQFRLEVHGDFAELPVYKKIIDIATNPNVTVCWNCNKDDLKGQGLEYNFNIVKDRFGAVAHVGDLDPKQYPFEELIKLFVKMDYKGWLLLEARGKPEDRVKALAEKRELSGQAVGPIRQD